MNRFVDCIAYVSVSGDWIAVTVDHDIMAQGKTFEEARQRLELAYVADHHGRTLGPCPVVKKFQIEKISE